MSTALVVVVVAAALGCPLHVAWQLRRGRRAACCPAPREDAAAEVHRRQQQLRASLAALDEQPAPDSPTDSGYAVRQ